jgi:hypothetical protein
MSKKNSTTRKTMINTWCRSMYNAMQNIKQVMFYINKHLKRQMLWYKQMKVKTIHFN